MHRNPLLIRKFITAYSLQLTAYSLQLTVYSLLHIAKSNYLILKKQKSKKIFVGLHYYFSHVNQKEWFNF